MCCFRVLPPPGTEPPTQDAESRRSAQQERKASFPDRLTRALVLCQRVLDADIAVAGIFINMI